MKKLIFIMSFAIYSIVANAQVDIDYGIKTGLNYNSNGDLSIVGTIAGLNEMIQSERDFGFHVGAYTQFNFTKLYVRPELIFTKTKSTYNNLLSPSSEFELTTLEVPVLAGIKIVKPLNVYLGPSFKYILDNDFSTLFNLNVENDIILGLNIGARLQLRKFGFDLRYTSDVSENLAVYFDDLPVDGGGYSIDTQSNQLILSFSYQLN